MYKTSFLRLHPHSLHNKYKLKNVVKVIWEQEMTPPLACASCAMSTAYKFHCSAASTLHPHHSAAFSYKCNNLFLFWCCTSLFLSGHNPFVFLQIVFNTVLLVCYCYSVLWPQFSNKYLLTYFASLQTGNNDSTSTLHFYRPDALPDTQSSVSKH